jgi:deoxyribose-phosphate aldolase
MPADPALARQLLPLLDLTCLNEDATPAQIQTLCARADGPHGRVAAVCVYPEHVQHARALLPESIAVATVVNFPEGGDDPQRVAREIRRARAVGAQEIDAVLPWRALLAGDIDRVRAVLGAAREASGGALLKIILESGELTGAEPIALASELALDAGADFLKTSTGKIGVGATLSAAHAMLDVIRRRRAPAGFKAAGGIRSLAQAEPYLQLLALELGEEACTPARLRFGASALLDQIEAALAGTAAAAGDSY